MGKIIEQGGRQEPEDSSVTLGFVRDLGQLELKLAAVKKKDGGWWGSEGDGEPYFSWMGEAKSEPEGKSNYLMVGLSETSEGKVVYISCPYYIVSKFR